MSIFEDIDLENAPELPDHILDNTYEALVTGFEVKETKDGSKLGLNLEYTITSEGPFQGWTVKDWQRIPKKGDVATEQPKYDPDKSKAYLKKRLLGIGCPEDKLNTVTAEDVIGNEVFIKTRANTNGDFVNVNVIKAEPRNGSATDAKNDDLNF